MTGESTLSGFFIRAAPRARVPSLRALTDLEALLEGLVAQARQAHPDLAFEPQELLRHLAARLPSTGDVGAALRCVRAEELLLALACLRGERSALTHLEQEVFSRVGSWFPGEDAAVVAEVGLRLRQHLLVAEGAAPPRLVSFTGRGPLTRWARAIAVRLLADLQRERPNHVPLDEAATEVEALVARDPELSFIRGRYQEPLRIAFQKALAALTPRERNLLRLHHLDNLSVDSVGTIYQTSRSTAARWIAQARKQLLNHIREELSARLELPPEELDSVLGLLRSHLDLSLHRLLRS